MTAAITWLLRLLVHAGLLTGLTAALIEASS